MTEPERPAQQAKLLQLASKELETFSSVRPAQPPKSLVDQEDRSSEEGDEVALVKPDKSDDVELGDRQGATPVEGTRQARSRFHRLIGLGYIVFGALNISLMSACIKYSTFYVTSHEAVFWRSSLSFLFNYVLLHHNKVDLKISGKHRQLLLLRCIFGTMSICFQFYAMSKMVLTDAVMIIFTSPVITFILGAVILREAIDKIDFLAAIFSYAGVIFVTRPAFLFHEAAKASSTLHDSSRSDGIASAMAAAVCQACAYIVMRKLHDVHHMASIHYFAGFGTIFSLVVVFITGSPLAIPPLWSVRFALVAAALFATTGLLSITIGFQREKAGIASVMRYFDVVFVIIWDSTFLGEHIHAYTLLGGAIILSGASVIAYRKVYTK